MKRLALLSLLGACGSAKDDEIADLQRQNQELQDQIDALEDQLADAQGDTDVTEDTDPSDVDTDVVDDTDFVDDIRDTDDTDPPPQARKILFLTPLTYDANLTGATGLADPHDAGDSICQAAAASAGHSGTFQVWLSTSSVDAIDHITGDGPWVVPTGSTQIFASKAGIPGGPADDIDEDVFGDLVSAPLQFWTATNTFGRYDGDDCRGWSSTDPHFSATTGISNRQQTWTNDGVSTCETRLRLLCFEE
jgi:hypothetical protein